MSERIVSIIKQLLTAHQTNISRSWQRSDDTVADCLLVAQKLNRNNTVQSKSIYSVFHFTHHYIRFKALIKEDIQNRYPLSNWHAAPLSTTSIRHISHEVNQQLWMPIMLTSQGYNDPLVFSQNMKSLSQACYPRMSTVSSKLLWCFEFRWWWSTQPLLNRKHQ